ncbi:hypothetical protein [Rhodococcus sp. HS-D2]|uniref:hypothetical protein n=1 Tax=Rhodococcus sp. HS-D2 TaxID=1384636 RepID=UPI0007D9EBF4|nr:hypothetical protein [Rhodococcus sp. HS-D2]
MQHENTDKDPDLRKKSDVEADAALLPPKPKWWQARWVLQISPLVAFAVLVLAGWAGLSLFEWWAGEGSDGAAAGAWASAFGATALAIASVWIAREANKQARAAEQRAEIEADRTEKRHETQMRVAEKRHESELAAANARADRQMKAEDRREHVRIIGAVGEAINRITEPSVMLAQRVDELAAGRPESSEQIVSELYSSWALKVFDIKFTISKANMVVDEEVLRSHLMDMTVRIDQLQRLGKNIKDAAINHKIANMTEEFTAALIALINKQEELSVATWKLFRPSPAPTPSHT